MLESSGCIPKGQSYVFVSSGYGRENEELQFYAGPEAKHGDHQVLQGLGAGDVGLQAQTPDFVYLHASLVAVLRSRQGEGGNQVIWLPVFW